METTVWAVQDAQGRAIGTVKLANAPGRVELAWQAGPDEDESRMSLLEFHTGDVLHQGRNRLEAYLGVTDWHYARPWVWLHYTAETEVVFAPDGSEHTRTIGHVACPVCRSLQPYGFGWYPSLAEIRAKGGLCSNCEYDKRAWGGPEGAARAMAYFRENG